MLLCLPVRVGRTDASWPRKRPDCALPIEAMMNRSNGIMSSGEVLKRLDVEVDWWPA